MNSIIGDEKVCEFRDGIFALRTRRFGTVAEILIMFYFCFHTYKKHLLNSNPITIFIMSLNFLTGLYLF